MQSAPALAETALLTSLLNDVAALSESSSLILDDYHVISAPSIHAGLAYLLGHLPEQMRLIVTTRADPPGLPLARLRARGQLSEIRAEDLRFTSTEAAQFLNHVMGLNVSAQDIAALESRTEGWVAGLQLAALSMQGRGDLAAFVATFTGSHTYIVDYLADEVFKNQSDEVRDFLLLTCLLDRLSAGLCDAVSDRDDGQQCLEALEHSNLFIVPLDDERRWYRYHHLFADFLRSRLQQTRSGHTISLKSLFGGTLRA